MDSVKLNHKRTDALLCLFKEYALMVFDFPLTEWQEPIVYETIFRVLMRKRHTIVISACRQVGKTESICCLLTILGKFFVYIFGERFRICITAPDRGTGSEVYDRTKLLIEKASRNSPRDFKVDKKNLDMVAFENGCTIESFGLFKGYASREGKKTTKEGRTYHLIVRDEMHLGDDNIYKDELEPAMSTTGGLDIFIGNGGYRDCKAKQLLDAGNTDDVSIFSLPYDYLREAVQREYEKTGNEMWLRWFDSQEKYIEENGIESDVVQKNLFLKWIVTVGSFFDWQKFQTFRRFNDNDLVENRCEAGIDWGKENDETWCTITDYHCNIVEWEIFKGEYEDQVEAIAKWLHKVKKERGLRLMGVNCDATSAQDVIVSLLRKAMRGVPVHGIVFTSKTKDALAKKALRTVRGKDPKQTLSYPANHKHTAKFEHQQRRLEKEYAPDGSLKYHHPKEHDAHDDSTDSWFLSLWRIVSVNQVRVLNNRTIG